MISACRPHLPLIPAHTAHNKSSGGLLPHSSLHIFPPVSLRKTRHLLHEGVLRSEASLPPLHNENWHWLDYNYAGALFISTAAHFSGAQEKRFVRDAFHLALLQELVSYRWVKRMCICCVLKAASMYVFIW